VEQDKAAFQRAFNLELATGKNEKAHRIQS